jgi:hypothetical protein
VLLAAARGRGGRCRLIAEKGDQTMKFVISKVDDRGENAGDITLPGVKKEVVAVENKVYITEEGAQKWCYFKEFLKKNPGGYRVEAETGYIIGIGSTEEVETIEVASCEELIELMRLAEYPFILYPREKYPYPEIVIYNGYNE